MQFKITKHLLNFCYNRLNERIFFNFAAKHNIIIMIQRIQSLYLAIVLILTGIILGTDLMNFTKAAEKIGFAPYKLYEHSGSLLEKTLPLAALFIIAFLIVAGALFMYKNRILQIRLAIFSMVLFVGSYALIYFYYHRFTTQLDIAFYSIGIALSFPLINAILLFLAIRNIGKDEALIRSLDRIR